MNSRTLLMTPQASFRAHMGHFMHEVHYNLNHIVLTHHRKDRAVIIPMCDARPLWHMQRRDLSRIDYMIKECYPSWAEAKEMTGSKRGMLVDGPLRTIWGGFGGM